MLSLGTAEMGRGLVFELARHNQEDTPDACIVSHQLRTTAFSTSVGFDWERGRHWKCVREFRRASDEGEKYQSCHQTRGVSWRSETVMKVSRHRARERSTMHNAMSKRATYKADDEDTLRQVL